MPAPCFYPRPAILERVPTDRHAVIEASAGTGKTYTLEHLVVELLLRREASLDQILVVTFTEKATREMRVRLRRTLRALLRPQAATPSREAAEEPAPSEAWKIDAEAARRIEEALAGFDRAPISTIHAFCQRVLSERAFECGRSLSQEQVDGREAFGKVFRELLRRRIEEGGRGGERLALLRALSERSAESLEELLYEWHTERGEPIPGFSPERAREGLAALPTAEELPPLSRALFSAHRAGTARALDLRLRGLAEVASLARTPGGSEAALGAFWSWAESPASKGNSLRYLLSGLAKAAPSEPSLAPLEEQLRELSASLGSPFGVLVHVLLPELRERLRREKQRLAQLDFDDMLVSLRDSLRGTTGARLRASLRRRYRFALVDEFQDTDELQWEIFGSLFFDSEEGHRLFLIGDPKQAIYGFRNADVHTYVRAKRSVLAAGGGRVALTDCYRSRPELLEALNRILEEGFFSGINRYDDPVRAGRPELTALDRGGEVRAPLCLLHLVGRPALQADRIREALAEAIAEEVRALLDGGLRVGPRASARPLEAHDIYVLTRSHGDGEIIAEALARAGIPFAFFKQGGLFETEAAAEVLSLLAAIDDPADPSRAMAAWLGPFFELPLAQAQRCLELPPEHPFRAQLRRFKRLAEGERWAPLFQALLDETGFRKRELFAGRGERRITDVMHLFEVLLAETHRRRQGLPQLIDRLRAFIEGRAVPAEEVGSVQRLESERRAVQLLTMHKAKGLEAEVVFLAGGLGRRRSSAFAPRVYHTEAGERRAYIGPPPEEIARKVEEEEREEDERLLYVALTRARSLLYLPYLGPPLGGAPPPAEEVSYDYGHLRGPYRVLNDRLKELVGGGLEGLADRVAMREVAVRPPRRASPPRPRPSGEAAPEDLSAARVGAALEELRAPEEGTGGEPFARLREERGGFGMSSYTRLKAGHRGAAVRHDPSPEEFTREVEDADNAGAEEGPGEERALPGGSAVGVFLHEALEHLDLRAVCEEREAEGWIARPEVEALLSRRARDNGLDPALSKEAGRLLFGALRTPIRLHEGALPGGLAEIEERVAEMGFLIPIPERSHPPISDPPPSSEGAPLRIERGFLRGVVDLVFRHRGLAYLLDWKSDRLPSYRPEPLREHVERHYSLQARLYVLGVLRALGIAGEEAYRERFGGLLYCFLRGMRPSAPGEQAEGVYFERPRFAEVVRWERTLREEQAPFGYLLPPRRPHLGEAVAPEQRSLF